MDQHQKYAYRYLLYWAMLDIRPIQWAPRGIRRINPVFWVQHIRDIRQRGRIAEWLHNMAAFSCRDFAGFDEQRFWSEYDRLLVTFPNLSYYRSIYKNALTESQTGRWPSVEEQKERDT